MDKKIYIGLAVLLLLAGAFYMRTRQSKQDDARHSAPASSSGAFPEIKLPSDDVDKVTKVAIKNGDKPEVVLEKRDDKWMVVKPIAATANGVNVKQLLDSLKDLKIKDSINDTPQAPSMYKDYQLEDDKALHATAWKGADKAFDVYFGKSGSRGQMARIAGKPAIWVVAGYSQFQFAREIKDWRNKEVLKFEDANVASISIVNEEGEYSLSKNNDKWSATFKKKDIERFDPDKVKTMLGAFKAMNAEDFADGKTDADLGLDKPAAVVEITLKDNAGKFKVSFGKVSSGTSRFARKDGDSTNFVIGAWASDWATAKVDKFQKPDEKDAGAKDDGGKKGAPGMPPGMPGMPPGMPGMPPGMPQ